MKLRQIPPILTTSIHTALSACDNARFSAGDSCPHCGAPLSGYDERKKRFAILIEEGRTAVVHVIIRRSWCRQCNRIISPPEPFYPGTRIGVPVVDLSRAVSRSMPYSRASRYLEMMGVIVDRCSVRQYSSLPLDEPRTLDLFGMNIPVSLISLSTLAGTLSDGESLGMDAILEICTHPAFRTPPD